MNIALYVPDLEALGLADSPVIEPVLSDLLKDIYLLVSDQVPTVYPFGLIQAGIFFSMNLAFSNKDLISPILSTSVSF